MASADRQPTTSQPWRAFESAGAVAPAGALASRSERYYYYYYVGQPPTAMPRARRRRRIV